MDPYIKASFWTDERLEEQPAEIKLTCLWLISNPSRDLLGMTRASAKRFTFETTLDAKYLDEACKALPSSFKKLAPGVYFAVNFLRHQFGKGGVLSLKNKVITAAMRHASHLPKALASPFYGAYPELLETGSESDGKESPKTSPLQAPSEKSEGVREEKRREEKDLWEEGMQGGKPDVAGIVALYPRRENVMAACTAVSESLRRGCTAEAIISGTRAIAAAIAQMPGKHLNKFVPSAEMFFLKRRWEDDPQTWLRCGANGTGQPHAPYVPKGRKGTTITISANNQTTPKNDNDAPNA